MIMSHSLCSKSLIHLKSCLQRSLTTNRPFPVLPDYMTEMGTEDAENALQMSNTALEQLRLLKKTCLHGGGQKGIDRHVKLNKKVLARDRVRQLLDPGTEFFELCMTAGLGLEYGDVPAGGIVSGVGKIHGCDVMVVANDGTVKGGTFYPITITKQLRLQEIARQNRLPCVAVVDTGGAFLPLQADIFLPGGRSFGNQAIMSSEGIQQVALVSGLCTAGGAYAPTMSDVAIITHKIGGELCDGKTMKERAKFIQTQSTVRVPKITLNVGGVAADENYTMCGPSFDPRFYMMWPSAAISKSDPTYIPDPLETPTTIKPKRKLSQFEFQDNSSAWAAARTLCDIVLEPKETRSVLSRAVQVAMFQHVRMRQERGVGRSVVRM